VRYSDATAVFVVKDLRASVAYFRDALDFTVDFEYGEPPFYAGLYRDAVSLHLQAASAATRPPGASALNVFVDDADAVHRELSARGARILGEPANRPYGLRDFSVADLDGNQLTFGSDAEAAAEE
jgi:catechol 2,3-dioxygenase-like lactoylglutathione lyase family enzyme